MNKLNRFALMSAIALTGAAGFTACSSEDELANNLRRRKRKDAVYNQRSCRFKVYTSGFRHSATKSYRFPWNG